MKTYRERKNQGTKNYLGTKKKGTYINLGTKKIGYETNLCTDGQTKRRLYAPPKKFGGEHNKQVMAI